MTSAICLSTKRNKELYVLKVAAKGTCAEEMACASSEEEAAQTPQEKCGQADDSPHK